MPNGLKLIAVFKTIRGIGALALAACLFWLSQQDLSLAGEGLLNKPYINRIIGMAGITPAWLSSFSEFNALGLSVLALLVSIVRFSEAVGIWFDQSWAEWLAVFTGLIAVTFFSWSLMSGFNWITFISLCVSILVIMYLLRILLIKRSHRSLR
ncbi:DUF2127 domain-containing protein [Polynucleobacter sp. 15G-AUS-farblos]|nr:DUF2127 domain-containing protein [Polynucleobacter sp. 15G-AUS-farblos]